MKKIPRALASAVTVAAVAAGAMRSDAAPVSRSYSAGKYEIALEGTPVGFVSSLMGGGPSSDVVTEAVGADGVAHKHLAGVKYDDISFTCGAGMSKTLYWWMKDSLERRYVRKSGAIETLSMDYKEQAHLNFANALITEIGFPALDGASREPGLFTVTLSPEYARRVPPTNAPVVQHESASKQRPWLTSNFQFQLSGLDGSRVSKVDAWVLKRKAVDHAVGDNRTNERTPTSFEIPDLVVTLAEGAAGDWYKWLDDFVVQGHNSDAQEKTGTLSYLAADPKTALFKLTLKHVGIVRIDPDTDGPADRARQVRVELYVEDVGFDFDSSTVF